MVERPLHHTSIALSLYDDIKTEQIRGSVHSELQSLSPQANHTQIRISEVLSSSVIFFHAELGSSKKVKRGGCAT
jgi:hypothetical protein